MWLGCMRMLLLIHSLPLSCSTPAAAAAESSWHLRWSASSHSSCQVPWPTALANWHVSQTCHTCHLCSSPPQARSAEPQHPAAANAAAAKDKEEDDQPDAAEEQGAAERGAVVRAEADKVGVWLLLPLALSADALVCDVKAFSVIAFVLHSKLNACAHQAASSVLPLAACATCLTIATRMAGPAQTTMCRRPVLLLLLVRRQQRRRQSRWASGRRRCDIGLAPACQDTCWVQAGLPSAGKRSGWMLFCRSI